MSDLQPKKKTPIWRRPAEKIREINQMYSNPRIHMSRAVKFSLIILRIYLIVMVLLLLYKFFTLV